MTDYHDPGWLGVDVTVGNRGYNPYSQTSYLLTIRAVEDHGFIVDANHLLCELVHWDRGNFGDPLDPHCTTDTLIGKPLSVLIPPMFRRAHSLFHMAFQAHPVPRTMGEGRNTPIWIKDPGVTVCGLDSIEGHQATVLIGLSAVDNEHTLAIVQPMEVGRQFTLPVKGTTRV